MAAPYRSGMDALHALLDVADAMPDRVRPPSAALDHASMTSADLQAAYDLFRKAETAGALMVRYERVGLAQKRPSKVVLADPDKLALFLGRERAAKTAALTKEIILKGIPSLPDALKPAIALIEAAWARSKVWRRLEPGDATGATQSLALASVVIARDRAALIDERTFSARTCGDSKALQRRRETILAILVESGAAKPGTTLEDFGIVAFPDPVLVRGPLAMELASGSYRLDVFDPFASVPPEQAHLAVRTGMAPYLITIENKASFQRHVRLVRDGSLVVFTSGFVSDPCATLLRRIVSPDMPWFHWGDVDPGGLSIFKWLEDNVAAPAGIILHPHLMTREIAIEHGTSDRQADARLAGIAKSNSAVADLARWLLEDPQARILEQEMLDPVPPITTAAPGGAA